MFPPMARPLKCLVPRFSVAQTMLSAQPLLGLRVRPCHSSADTTPPPTFASLVRNCKFTMMGNPVGKEVVGRIYHVVEEDLYIDFGHKFGCVCRVPREGRRNFIRGTEVGEKWMQALQYVQSWLPQVRLRVNSLELSKRFLGYDKDLSLLEADCTLLGLNK